MVDHTQPDLGAPNYFCGMNTYVRYSEIQDLQLLLPDTGDPVNIILRTQSGKLFTAIQCIPCPFYRTIQHSYSVKANNKLHEYNGRSHPA